MTLEINISVCTNMYMLAYTIFFLSNKHKIEWVYKGMLQLLHKTIDASKHSLKHLPQLKYTTQFHKNLVPINLTHSLLNLPNQENLSCTPLQKNQLPLLFNNSCCDSKSTIAFTNIIVLTLYIDNNNPCYILFSSYLNYFTIPME